MFNPRRDYPLVRRLPSNMRKLSKWMLSLGPDSHALRIVAHSPRLRRWRNHHLDEHTPSLGSREALYAHLRTHALREPFTYLEFGCASGETVKHWAARCTHPDSRFIGFDTFTGMPEAWQGLGWHVPEGAWSLGGAIPQADDQRVRFVKGRFQDSLAGFLQETGLLTDTQPCVIHLDADLYSSTLYVLCELHAILPGTVVIFDEFDCVLDELRALEDFCATFDLSYTVLATAVATEKVAVRFKTGPEHG